MTLLDERITDEAIRKRLTACQPWVKALLFEMLPIRQLDDLPQGLRFCAFDGSSIQAPGATGTDYRLHIGMDLVTLEFTHLLVTDKHTGESLKNYPLNQGDVAVIDRGLCHATGILKKQMEGADVIARYNPAVMPLYKEDGTPLDVIAYLKSNLEFEQLTQAVSAKVKKDKLSSEQPTQLKGHLIVLRLPFDTAKAERSRCIKQAAKKSRSMPSKDTLFLAGFLMVFTTLSPEILPAQTVLELYKCRWQIEIAIKRLKSLLNIEHKRSKEGTTADIWLNGKGRNALMLDKRMQKQLGDDWDHLHLNKKQRNSSKWRPLKLLKQQIEPIITGVQFWISSNWENCLSVLIERPRRRKLQILPKKAIKLFELYSNTEVPFY